MSAETSRNGRVRSVSARTMRMRPVCSTMNSRAVSPGGAVTRIGELSCEVTSWTVGSPMTTGASGEAHAASTHAISAARGARCLTGRGQHPILGRPQTEECMEFIHHLWLPIVVAAVIVFIVSALIWTAMPWHKKEFEQLPDEDGVMAVLRKGNLSPGMYLFPFMTHEGRRDKAKMEA